MAQDDLTKCLTDAAKAMLAKTGLTEDQYREVMSRLKQAAGNIRRTPEERIIAVEQAILNARQDLLQEAVASLKANEVSARLASDPRFRYDPEDFDSIARAADNWRAFISNRRGGKGDRTGPTVYARIRAETRWLGARFKEITDVTSDTWPKPRDSKEARDFYKEMVGIETGNARAKHARDVFREVVGEYLERLRAAGIYTEKLENYFPQQHDTVLIWSDLEGWKKYLVEHLDPKYHPDPEATVEALQKSLASRDVTENVGSRISMRRKIRLDSPESELEYYYRFGHGNVTRDMQNMVMKLARETVIAEELGPRASALMDEFGTRFKTDAQTIRPTQGAANKVIGDMDLARDILAYQTQPVSNPRFQGVANWAAALRLGISGSLLGRVFIDAMFEDPVIASIAGRAASGGYWKSTTGRIGRALELLDATGDARKFVEKWGLWQDTVMMLQSARTIMDPNPPGFFRGGQQVPGSGAREAMQTYAGFTQRIQGAHYAENLHRSASFMQFHDAVTEALQRGWDDLTPGQREVFGDLGMTPQDWKVLQKVRVDPNLKIIDLDDLRKRSPKVHQRYLASSTRQAEIAVNYPDAESLLKAYGLNRDDYPGLAWHFITQFWGWGWSVARNALSREVYAGVVPGTVAFGATFAASMATLQLRTMSAGNPPFEWDSGELWKQALARNAMFGPAAPAAWELFGSNDYFAGGVPGVVPSVARRTISGSLRAGGNVWEGDIDEAGVEAIKIGRQFIPNWWFTDAALRHGTDAMIFELDPGELRKRNRRWKEDERMGQ